MASSSPNKMNCNLVPSLENMALIKTAIALWNKNDIYLVSKLVMMKHYQPSFILMEHMESWEWKMIESEVSEKIQQLNQPQLLKDKISCFIKPIGLEILHFIKYHDDLYGANGDVFKFQKIRHIKEKIKTLINPDELYWTPQGTINRKKTAEALIRDENLDIKKQNLLACHYCLEKDIFDLWSRISKGSEIHVYNKFYIPTYLVNQWTSYIKGEVMFSEAYEDLFYDSIKQANLEATKYFFAKINTMQKNTSQINFDRFMSSSDIECKEVPFEVIRFVFSQLNEDQETEVIQRYAKFVLCSVLKWPWQPLFTQVTKQVCDFLDMRESEEVLREIAYTVIRGYKDYDYHVLFREFWKQIPTAHRRFVVEQIPDLASNLLEMLLEIKDLENFYLILREATAVECIKIFRKQEWCIAFVNPEEFIHYVFMSSPSKDVVQFAREFRECILCYRAEEEIEKDKESWNKLFQFVDDHLIHYSKITIEVE